MNKADSDNWHSVVEQWLNEAGKMREVRSWRANQTPEQRIPINYALALLAMVEKDTPSVQNMEKAIKHQNYGGLNSLASVIADVLGEELLSSGFTHSEAENVLVGAFDTSWVASDGDRVAALGLLQAVGNTLSIYKDSPLKGFRKKAGKKFWSIDWASLHIEPW